MHQRGGFDARGHRSGRAGVPAVTRGTVRVRIRERARRGSDGIVRVAWEVIVGSGPGRTVAGTRETEAGARALMGEVAGQVASGVLAEPTQRPTRVTDLMKAFRETKDANPRLRPKSREAIRFRSQNLSNGLGQIPLELLNRAHVAGYVRLRLRSVAPETVHDDVAVLSQALRLAVQEGWWSGEAAELCAGHGLQGQGHRKWLRARDVDALLDAIDNPDVRMVARIALGTGMRVGEILHFRWADWLREEGVILIRSKADEGWQPKDGEDRLVPVDDDLAAHLEAHERDLAARHARRAAKGRPSVPFGQRTPVIPTRNGTLRSDRAWFARRVGAAAVKAGLDRITVHELRHSFATHWLQAGGSLFDLSKILGHYSPEFTARQYAHVCCSHLRAEANVVRAKVRAAGATRVAEGVTTPVTCDTTPRLAVA